PRAVLIRNNRRPGHIDVISKKRQGSTLEHGQIRRVDLQLLNLRTSRQRSIRVIGDLYGGKEHWRIAGRCLRRAHIKCLPTRVRWVGWFGVLNVGAENWEIRRATIVFFLLRKFAGCAERSVDCEIIVVAEIVPGNRQLSRGKRHAGHELMSAAGPIINYEWSAPLQGYVVRIRGRDS